MLTGVKTGNAACVNNQNRCAKVCATYVTLISSCHFRSDIKQQVRAARLYWQRVCASFGERTLPYNPCQKMPGIVARGTK